MNNIFKELYKRLIIPMYIPILMITPLFLITSSKENLNYSKIRLFTFLIGLLFVITSESTIRFISESFIKNYSISFMPLIFLIIIYLFFYKKFNPIFK